MLDHQIKTFRDPVCGMSTENKSDFVTYHYKSDIYFFYSDHCVAKFTVNPETYGVGNKKGHHHDTNEEKVDQGKSIEGNDNTERRNSQDAKVIYTCPMHSEIEQDGSGSCPKYGMVLAPRDVSLEQDEENPEYHYMKKRFVFGAILTVPLVVIAMREMLPGGHLIDGLASPRTLGWLELILATSVVLWAGWPFYVRGVQSAINKSLNKFTLISLGGLSLQAFCIQLLGILLSPMIAAAAMSLSSVSVVGNALRLKAFNEK